MHTTLEQVRRFVVSNFLFDMGEIKDDASLTGDGVIDSTGVLELVMFAEETFGIVVADDDVTPEHFDTVARLGAYIDRQRIAELSAVG